MRFHRLTKPKPAPEGPHPIYDESSGELYYGDNVAVMTTNPPDLILAPAAFVLHPSQIPPAERGPYNDQLFQSGETQIVTVNPANEQGVGRAPGFQWAHYPHVQQFNPTIQHEYTLQDGQGFSPANPGNDNPRSARQAIWPEGYLNYMQQPDQHHWWPAVANVNQAETAAFVQTVPNIE
jgi:hypothetical protein